MERLIYTESALLPTKQLPHRIIRKQLISIQNVNISTASTLLPLLLRKSRYILPHLKNETISHFTSGIVEMRLISTASTLLPLLLRKSRYILIITNPLEKCDNIFTSGLVVTSYLPTRKNYLYHSKLFKILSFSNCNLFKIVLEIAELRFMASLQLAVC